MATWDLRTTKHHVLICNGSSCKKAGAEEVTQAIRREISNRDLDSVIHTSRTLCNGRCLDKCVVISYPEGVWYKEILPEDAPTFIESILSHKGLESKISHIYTQDVFFPTEGTVIGKMKDKETVKKVSKKM